MVENLLTLEKTKINGNQLSCSFLIYGQPGIGKTTFSTQLFGDRSILLGAEYGFKLIPNIYAVAVPDYITLTQYVDQLDTDEIREKFDTIIIDTVTRIGEIIEAFILSKYGKDSLGDCKPLGGAYPYINLYYNRLFDRLKKRGYNFIYICHATVGEIKDLGGNVVKKIKPLLTDRISKFLEPEVDFIFYLTQNPQGEKMVVTDNTPYNVGKQRIKMAQFLPLNAEIVKKEIADSIERESSGQVNNELRGHIQSFKSERNYQEILRDIQTIYENIKDEQLKEQIVIYTNKMLGTDYNGEQITFATANQDNAESLELILLELKKLVGGQ